MGGMEILWLVAGGVLGFVVVSRLMGGSRKEDPTARLRDMERQERASHFTPRVVLGVPVSAEVQRLAALDQKMLAIQQLRTETGVELPKAKAILDELG